MDAQIYKLKNANKKKDIFLKRKVEELAEIKKADTFFQQLIKGDVAAQKMMKKKKLKKLDVKNILLNKSNEFSEEDADDLMDVFTLKINENIQLVKKMESQEQELKNLEDEFEINKAKQAELILEQEKLKFKKQEKLDLQEEQEIESNLKEIESELKHINNLLENQESSLDFLLENFTKSMDEYIKTPLLHLENEIFNDEKMQSIVNLKLLFRKLMHKYITCNFQRVIHFFYFFYLLSDRII